MKVTNLKNKETDLAVDLQTRGCAVCNHVIKTARDFFAQWQYALSSEEQTQSSFAVELGFCPLHAWQLHAMSSPWGESIGLAKLVKHLSKRLREANRDPDAASIVQKILHTSENCRVCRILRDAETTYIKRLGDFVLDPRSRELYERSQGVCLRHLASLLSIVSSEIRQSLLATTSRHFAEMQKEMQSYAKKREAVRRDLITKDEEDAYLRALIHVAGAKEYSGP
jgi:hypothetical protein